MTLRRITPADNAAMKQIIQADLKANDLALPGTVYFDPEIDDLYQAYQNLENSAYWVLSYEGQVVGGVGIAPYPDYPGVCELQKLYLDAAYQGRGLSKTLMAQALDYGAKHYEICYLETHSNLVAAWHLYEKYDFQPLTQPLGSGAHSVMNRWYVKKF
ncbi:GNAT family N-acetyltransferase [Agrilactobacillus yilanensis]|uniref:GNAT family N-acetyltransferase n=1 Tax=Agrilactobacillus yilanensis TaxID=2485997 RepID=A0ABW4J9N9_9LACO|nr:GNAT family N-acetyltransferase [Agrilactobacillus yilanensis]